MLILFAPREYENPLTEQGRARTIAAFHIAQGNTDRLTTAEMRRDILRRLMSPRAVSYWLNDKAWLRVSRKVGRIMLLQLTDAGLQTCANSVAGGSDVPTTPELVAGRRELMLCGGPGHTREVFPLLGQGAVEARVADCLQSES